MHEALFLKRFDAGDTTAAPESTKLMEEFMVFSEKMDTRIVQHPDIPAKLEVMEALLCYIAYGTTIEAPIRKELCQPGAETPDPRDMRELAHLRKARMDLELPLSPKSTLGSLRKAKIARETPTAKAP